MPLFCRQWLQLILICCTLVISSFSNGQATLSDTPLTSQQTNTTELDFTSLQPVTFLSVDEAYQLSAELVAPDTLRLHWAIADGYYLYRKQLRVTTTASSQPLELTLPVGSKKYDEYFEEEVEVYYHNLNVELQTPQAPANKKIKLSVTSQGCADAGLCYPPQTQIVLLENGQAHILQTTDELLPGLTANTSPARADNNNINTPSLLVALISAAIGGLLLNLMPCVFPVLSLKALSLANSHQQPHRLHLHGWAYTLGAITLFVVIAAIMLSLRHAGQAVGWGFQLQSPIVTGGLAYLFFTMALLLSGSYNLGGRFSGIGQSLTEGHSLKSSFFTGALACVVASPCTAPFMGGALGFAVTQPTYIALTIFAALGFGMALPFLLLSYFPSLSNHLPKPGRWMDIFRQFLAFPLYLTALWLLWVLGRQAGSDAIILLGLSALALVFAFWLMQFERLGVCRNLLVLAALLLVLLPLAQITTMNTTQTREEQSSDWQPYSEQTLKQHLQSNTPVFVNLTADWCITCLANEKAVLSRESIQSAFDAAGVVKIKGDWTNYNAEITRLLSQFGRTGVPLYLLYSGSPDSPPVILPQILSSSAIEEAILQIKSGKVIEL